MINIQLRDYQQDTVSKVRGVFKQGRKRPLVVLPCG